MDKDNDGFLDIIVAGANDMRGSSGVFYLHNSGDGTLTQIALNTGAWGGVDAGRRTWRVMETWTWRGQGVFGGCLGRGACEPTRWLARAESRAIARLSRSRSRVRGL